jgi:hypothetical protein
MKDLLIECKTREEKIAATTLCYAYGFTHCNYSLPELVEKNNSDLYNDHYCDVVIYGRVNNTITFSSKTWKNRNTDVDVVNWSDGLVEIIERLKCKAVKVKISKDYDALVDKEGITVGCQKISFEDFNKLAEVVKTFQ